MKIKRILACLCVFLILSVAVCDTAVARCPKLVAQEKAAKEKAMREGSYSNGASGSSCSGGACETSKSCRSGTCNGGSCTLGSTTKECSGPNCKVPTCTGPDCTKGTSETMTDDSDLEADDSETSEYSGLVSALGSDKTELTKYDPSMGRTSKWYAKTVKSSLSSSGYTVHIGKAYLEKNGKTGVRYFNVVETDGQSVPIDCTGDRRGYGTDKLITQCEVGKPLLETCIDQNVCTGTYNRGTVTGIKMFE